jgi:hypothetical protein
MKRLFRCSSAVLAAVVALSLGACHRDKTPPTVTASPAGGNFEAAQQVMLSANEEGAKIHYTLDGTDPTKTSAEFSGPITVEKTATLKFIGVDKADNVSAVASETYTITPPDTTPPTVAAEPKGGEYDVEQTVVLTATDPEGSATTIYFTEDGSEPTEASTAFDAASPIKVAKTTTLKFLAKDEKGNLSPVAVEEYKIKAAKAAKKGKK